MISRPKVSFPKKDQSSYTTLLLQSPIHWLLHILAKINTILPHIVTDLVY